MAGGEMFKNLQKIGGVASLGMAATFIFGMIVFFTLLEPGGFMEIKTDLTANAAFVADNQAMLSLWYLIIYVVFGVLLVVLTVALYERFKAATVMAKVASSFGLLWAGLMFASGMLASVGVATVVDLYGHSPDQAGTLWLALHSVITGLGGGNEIVGGLWIVLLSWTAISVGKGLPKNLAIFGLMVGAAGIVQTLLGVEVEALGAIFGLGTIVWFIWVGVYLLQDKKA